MKKHIRKPRGPLSYEMGEIEKGVKMPNGRIPASDIPFSKMKKGDSILFVGKEGEAVRIQSTVSAKASNFKKTYPELSMNFSTHIEDGCSVRLWRIA